MRHFFLLFILFATLSSCGDQQAEVDPVLLAAQTEAREDSIALALAYQGQSKVKNKVEAVLETALIDADEMEDAADDPAIWIHPTDVSESLVYGSNKTGGLAAYDLSGKEVAYYPIGKVNNVDVLYNFPIADSTVSLLGCSNRTTQGIDLFIIHPLTGRLDSIEGGYLKIDNQQIDDIYGFCFATDKNTATHYAIVNGKNGHMQQFKLHFEQEAIHLELVRSVQFDSQTEGMVADADFGCLYVGEEGKGIWKLDISPDSLNKKTLLADSRVTNEFIAFDIEGLTLLPKGEGGYLIASSQGNFSYAIFDRTDDNRYLTSFTVVDGDHTDGAEETDGLDVVPDSLSPVFPHGLLVVQDGFNYDGEKLQPQNFKYISWESLKDFLK